VEGVSHGYRGKSFTNFVMKKHQIMLHSFMVLTSLMLCACGRPEREPAGGAKPHHHAHHAPHGGTPVVLGDELYHLELVRDGATGTLQAYVLDGEMHDFIRLPALEFVIEAPVGGEVQVVVLRAVANAATGETVGDTALFEAQAEWLKTTASFDATLRSIAIRGRDFSGVKFNFPRGNE
jgi:hypothetical protein